jgi:hypothetical protein
MANIIRNKSFWIGFIFGILFTFAGLFVAYKIDSKRTEIIEVLDVEGIDTVSDIYKGMTEEEFMNEMQKGCYGDFTQEQIDSLELDLALFNHGVPDSIIKIWGKLSDKQKINEILGVPLP